MELNTEYGAMAILSASSYGNQNKIGNGETTTGNKSGVYMLIQGEWVAAGIGSNFSGRFNNTNKKYINMYGRIDNMVKQGDAMQDVKGWHNASNDWLHYSRNWSYILRNFGKSIFSYSGAGINNSTTSNTYASRAVIVVGTGL